MRFHKIESLVVGKSHHLALGPVDLTECVEGIPMSGKDHAPAKEVDPVPRIDSLLINIHSSYLPEGIGASVECVKILGVIYALNEHSYHSTSSCPRL